MESATSSTEMPPLEEARPVEQVPQWQIPNLERRDSKDMLDQIGTCRNPVPTRKIRKVKRKDESLVGTLRATIVQHQLGTLAFSTPMSNADVYARLVDQLLVTSLPHSRTVSSSPTYH